MAHSETRSAAAARRTYRRLLKEAQAALSRDNPQLDPLLHNPDADGRRAFTLIARVDAGVRERVRSFIHGLAAQAPGQHVYRDGEIHLTVLSVFSGSEGWRQHVRHLPSCRAAIRHVLHERRPFPISFRGAIASPGAVMICGFPPDESLESLREDLREEFTRRQLPTTHDRRYRLVTAHLTVMRFCSPRADWPELLSWLATHRETDFGASAVEKLQFVWSDWYMTSTRTRVLEEYALG